VYYSVSSFGSHNSAIGLAVSASLDVGTWTDLGSTGIRSSSSTPYNAIDANLICVNGMYYVTFGSFWKDIYQVQMTSTAVYVANETKSSQLAYDPVSTAEEGSYMFRYGDYYYLFYSKGQCCGYDNNKPAPGGEYKIMVCRSMSVSGEFIDKTGQTCKTGGGTVVLESHGYVYGPGGQGVYQDPTYGPVSLSSQDQIPVN